MGIVCQFGMALAVLTIYGDVVSWYDFIGKSWMTCIPFSLVLVANVRSLVKKDVVMQPFAAYKPVYNISVSSQ